MRVAMEVRCVASEVGVEAIYTVGMALKAVGQVCPVAGHVHRECWLVQEELFNGGREAVAVVGQERGEGAQPFGDVGSEVGDVAADVYLTCSSPREGQSGLEVGSWGAGELLYVL